MKSATAVNTRGNWGERKTRFKGRRLYVSVKIGANLKNIFMVKTPPRIERHYV